MAAHALNAHQHGVATGYQQRYKRERRRIRFQHRRQQMPLKVVNRDGRDAPRQRQRGCKPCSYQQRADQSRPARVRYRGDVVRPNARVRKRLTHQRYYSAYVVAGCNFGYDAAVFRVQFNLAVQAVAQQPTLAAVDGYTGFVARTLDT